MCSEQAFCKAAGFEQRVAQQHRVAHALPDRHGDIIPHGDILHQYRIFHLREFQKQTDSDETTKAIQMERVKELQDFIGQQGSELTEFDEKLVKRWLRQITVWDDHYTVELKSGLSIDIEC